MKNKNASYNHYIRDPLIDNLKATLILLVVFNHLIAFQAVKYSDDVKLLWYGITFFHMPTFVLVSGYLSKKPQSVEKNIKNLLVPYVLGYTLTWAFFAHLMGEKGLEFRNLAVQCGIC